MITSKRPETDLVTRDFFYDLPEELIAQTPAEPRDSARLLVADRATGELSHRIFRDLPEYLRPGDTLVINDSKVIPARLMGTKEETGVAVELVLLRCKGGDRWETLVRPGRRCRPGTVVSFGNGLLRAVVLETLPEERGFANFPIRRRKVAFSPYSTVWGKCPCRPIFTKS